MQDLKRFMVATDTNSVLRDLFFDTQDLVNFDRGKVGRGNVLHS